VILLLDNNLSAGLVKDLARTFPGTTHVRELGMAAIDDEAIWRVAKAKGMCIVSKDDEFRQRATLRGHPSKVIVLRVGNCATERTGDLLRDRAGDIRAFGEDPESSVMILS
jgi:predicted nuclease of predicted toxin-antitoxin system